MTAVYLEYWTTDGDRLDLIAWNHYGDASRFEPILQANPSLFTPSIPPVLEAGLLLKIPILEERVTSPSASLPPWLR